jgi:putative peptidoglycan lipid II flippase
MGAALRSSSSGARTTAIGPSHAQAEPRRASPAEAERPEKGPGFLSSEGRKILPIIFLIVAAIAAAIVIATLIDPDTPNEGGGNGAGGGNGTKIDITGSEDFDPHGDDNAEHPEEVPLAHDGDAATFWTTQDYNDPIGLLKDGVGIVFDLGEPTEVSGVEVTFDGPGYAFELRAADDIGSDQSAFEEVESISSSDAVHQVAADGTTARFWLIWITDLPGGGGGSGSIAEVRFFGD